MSPVSWIVVGLWVLASFAAGMAQNWLALECVVLWGLTGFMQGIMFEKRREGGVL